MEYHSKLEKIAKTVPALISILLGVMIFTSRLAISVRAIALVISLVLILFTVPLKELLKTYIEHPIARAAALFYACFIVGSFYGGAPTPERWHLLKIYLPLLWIGFLITFFQKFSLKTPKTSTYIAIFVHGAVLTTVLGCLNTWHIVNVTELVHSHLTFDPPEYPFGTFSFSLSLATYLCAQQMRYAATQKIHIYYAILFLFLTFFIFFISHQRTAYILYAILILFYGYQHWQIRGIIKASIWIGLLILSANYSSPTFQTRSIEAVHDVQNYQQGNPISSTGLRLFFIKESLLLWEKEPLFGYGTGSFKDTYLTIDGYNAGGQKNTPENALDQPHNDSAYILVQLGFFGFIFFAWLLFQQVYQSFWSSSRLPHFEKQCAQGFILCVIFGSLDATLFFYATSMTDYMFFSALFYASMQRLTNSGIRSIQ